MARLILAAALIIGLCGCRGGEKAKKAEPEYEGTIVAAGDSLTAGFSVPLDETYPARLEKRLLKEGYRYKVVNAGSSGETSSGLLSRLRWILSLNPDIVILETGANDGFRGVSPELTRKNIQGTVRLLKASNVTVVLAGMQIVQNLGKDYTDAFKEIYPSVAREEGVILMPFFLEGVAGDPEFNQSDGIHPTAKGYGVVVDRIYPYVIDAIKRSKGGVR